MSGFKGFLVELPDGRLVRKAPEDLATADQLVFDGPDAVALDASVQAALEAQIAAAGGLQAWKAQGQLW